MADFSFDGKTLRKQTGQKMGEVDRSNIRAWNGARLGEIEGKNMRDPGAGVRRKNREG